MTARDSAFLDWLRAGQAVTVEAELARRGHLARLKRAGAELAGPCPLCGGHDRFALHPRRDLWNCRRCAEGGDAIALVRHLDGCDFLLAVETLTGEPPPGREAGESATDRQAREDRQRAMAAVALAEAAERAALQESFREKERLRAFEIWRRGRSPVASPVEAYLRLRKLTLPQEAQIRFAPAQPLWDGPPPHGKVVHRGPAMLARIERPDGQIGGVHITWIDLSQPKGKALVPDRETGEFVPAKKVRGSQRGGSIGLAKPLDGLPARMLLIGEGIETVLTVRDALLRAGADLLRIAEFRAGVSLGNLAGKAMDKVAHPTLTRSDKLGRVRRRMVPGPTPLLDRQPVIAIGAQVETIILLGDGDSDPFETRLAIERAAARFEAAYPHVTVRLAMSAEGVDFNDQWMALAEHRGTTLPADPIMPAREASSCPV